MSLPKRTRLPAFVTLLVTIVASITLFPLFAPVFLGERHLSALALGIRAVFLSYATVLIVSHALRAQKVTGDTIAAAACAYVLTAVTWGQLL